MTEMDTNADCRDWKLADDLGHIRCSSRGVFLGVRLNRDRLEGVSARYLAAQIVSAVSDASSDAYERRRQEMARIGIR